MSENRIELLRRMAIFGGLRTESLELILEFADDVQVECGDYFVHEGDAADSLFVLEEGSVTIERAWNGQVIVLGSLHKGDCFGEMSLIDFMPRSASVQAQSTCRGIEVPNQSLRELLKKDVEQYAMIMMNLGREVSRRLRIADDQLFELQHKVTAS